MVVAARAGPLPRRRAPRRAAGPAEAAWLEAHLAECPACRAVAAAYAADRAGAAAPARRQRPSRRATCGPGRPPGSSASPRARQRRPARGRRARASAALAFDAGPGALCPVSPSWPWSWSRPRSPAGSSAASDHGRSRPAIGRAGQPESVRPRTDRHRRRRRRGPLARDRATTAPSPTTSRTCRRRLPARSAARLRAVRGRPRQAGHPDGAARVRSSSRRSTTRRSWSAPTRPAPTRSSWSPCRRPEPTPRPSTERPVRPTRRRRRRRSALQHRRARAPTPRRPRSSSPTVRRRPVRRRAPPASGRADERRMPPAREASEPSRRVAIITDVTVVGRAAAYSPDGAVVRVQRPAGRRLGRARHLRLARRRPAGSGRSRRTTPASSPRGSAAACSAVAPAPARRGNRRPAPSPPANRRAVEPTLEVPPPIDAPPARDPSAATESTAPETEPVTVERLPQAFLIDPATGLEIRDGRCRLAAGRRSDRGRGRCLAGHGRGRRGGPDHRTGQRDPGSPPVSRTARPAGPARVGFAGPGDVTDDFADVLARRLAGRHAGWIRVRRAAQPSPSALADFPSQVVAAGPIADFDARWDETGSWLAVWIADPVDPALGRLSLLHFDPATGLLDRPVGAPRT